MSTIAVTGQSSRARSSRGVAAHPRRRVRGVVRGGVTSCRVERPAGSLSAWGRVKVAAITVLAVVGGIVGVTGYIDAISPEPAVGQGVAEGAWAHVER